VKKRHENRRRPLAEQSEENNRGDRQTGRQRDRQGDRQTGRQTDRETERQTDRETERQTDRETERQTDRETERQRDRETERREALRTNSGDGLRGTYGLNIALVGALCEPGVVAGAVAAERSQQNQYRRLTEHTVCRRRAIEI